MAPCVTDNVRGHAEQPLRRGGARRDDDVHVLDLGGVRPLHGRRREHGHEVGRQRVQRLVPDDVHERRLAGASRRERGASRRSSRPSTRRRSAGRSGRTTSGSSARAGTSTRHRTARPSITNISYNVGDNEKRYQGKLTLTPVANHSFTANYLKVDEKQTNSYVRQHPRPRQPRALAGRFRRTSSPRTTTAS